MEFLKFLSCPLSLGLVVQWSVPVQDSKSRSGQGHVQKLGDLDDIEAPLMKWIIQKKFDV